MAESITLTAEDGMLRLKTTYGIDMDGQVALSVLVPNANHPIAALQAMACEFAAAALTRRAQSFRQIEPSAPVPD